MRNINISLCINLNAEGCMEKLKDDPYYTDQINYEIPLSDDVTAKVIRISVKLYSQSILPFYLQQKFRDANVGSKKMRFNGYFI